MTTSHFRLSAVVFLTYLIAVLLVAFWPVPIDRSMSVSLEGFIEWFHRHGMPKFIGYRDVEFAANVIFFVPMGAILALWIKNRFVTVAIATYISMSIEVVQAVALPQRYSSIFDIVANTLGAVVGAFIFCPLANLLISRYDHYKIVQQAAKEEDQKNAASWLTEKWSDEH